MIFRNMTFWIMLTPYIYPSTDNCDFTKFRIFKSRKLRHGLLKSARKLSFYLLAFLDGYMSRLAHLLFGRYQKTTKQ